jgi:hypothetical protein
MRVLHLVESEFQGVSEACRLVEAGGKIPLRPLPCLGISFKIGFGYFLLKRLQASLELGFSHAQT